VLIVKNFYSLIVLPCIVILLMFGGQVWAQTSKPNILVIWGDDIGRENAGVRCERTGLLCLLSGRASTGGAESNGTYAGGGIGDATTVYTRAPRTKNAQESVSR
jgi:hypothetical protein